MGRVQTWGFAALAGLCAISLMVFVKPSEAAITGLQQVASSGLSNPIFITHAPGDRSRLFIVQRAGAIRILNLNTGVLEATPFLSIPSVDTGGEGGLLGMAFHPDYATNGKFYVNVTIDNGGQVFQDAVSPFSTHIRQYTVSANPNVANPTPTEVLSFIQPQSNHNAGWIGFSPINGYLYIPTGDGGSGDDLDPDGNENDGDVGGHTQGTGNAQDLTNNLLGKILRIDVNDDDFPADANRNYAIPPDNPYFGSLTNDNEIWARGMRNPFRDSFDRLTGDLWLGDVGQSAREEIDRQPADAPGGENFGWRLREGNIQTPSGVGGAIPANYRAPVYDYNRDFDQFGGSVVTGGYVYRGPDPSLQGQYFFADSRNSGSPTDDNYWMFDPANPFGTVTNIDSTLGIPTVDAGSGGTHRFPVSFGEDAVGNLYIAYLFSNQVYRIVTNELLPGDYDADGFVNDLDIEVWRRTFGQTGANLAADGNKDGTVDAADFVLVQKFFGTSVHDGAGSGNDQQTPEPSTGLILLPVIALSFCARLRRH